MVPLTLKPNGRRLQIEVPEAFADQPLEVFLVPVAPAPERALRHAQLTAFFAQYQAEADQLRYDRAELYER